jgi:hypothetical protein
MNIRMMVVTLIFSLYAAGTIAQDHAQSSRTDARGGHQPPPQAYEDCRGKQVGATVQHMTREGIVAATCAYSPDGLVARPNQPPTARADGPTTPTTPAEGQASLVPAENDSPD